MAPGSAPGGKSACVAPQAAALDDANEDEDETIGLDGWKKLISLKVSLPMRASWEMMMRAMMKLDNQSCCSKSCLARLRN